MAFYICNIIHYENLISFKFTVTVPNLLLRQHVLYVTCYLLINSICTQVFIRELISNASDALEKLRHLFLTGTDMTEKEQSLEIHLATNEENGSFILQDYGCGMTKEELIENLGTIAQSGSKAFANKLQQRDDVEMTAENIIGQFGVGFYSAFMVADKVDVYTRSYKPNSKGYLWSSDGYVKQRCFLTQKSCH